MKYLLIRFGAYGDHMFVEPVIRYLKSQGHYIIYSTTSRGETIMRNNPNIDELVVTSDDEVDIAKVWKEQIDKYKADKVVNFSESIEVALLIHPQDPRYNLPKYERIMQCDKNAFDQSFEWAGIDSNQVDSSLKNPKIYLTEDEIEWSNKFFKDYKTDSWVIEPKRKMVIMWAVSGSGLQKVYPFQMSVIKHLIEKYQDLYFITVGDESCQLLEMDRQVSDNSLQVINMSGKINYRQTLALMQNCDIVIAPETGIIVSSGATNIPKIGMFASITKNHVTTYFENDYSIDAQGVGCAPCYRFIQDKRQCPLGILNAPICQEIGFDFDKVINHIENVMKIHYKDFINDRQK